MQISSAYKSLIIKFMKKAQENSFDDLVCSEGYPLSFVCLSPECSKFSFYCGNPNCFCSSNHLHCYTITFIKWIKEKISVFEKSKKLPDFERKTTADLLNFLESIMCKEQKPIKFICCESNCTNPSLHCQNEDCKNCSKNHTWCKSIQYSSWAATIKQEFILAEKSIRNLHQLEQKMLKKMPQFRNESLRTYFGWMPEESADLLMKVFIDKNLDSLKGNEASKITEIMKNKMEKSEIREKQVLENFCLESDKIVESYQKLKAQSIQNLTKTNLIGSKLIYDEQELSQLKAWLKNPIKIQLIFRASEYGFSAAKFHQVCDNIPHTLVIAKTEFGKRIGGYTQLTWNSANSNYSNDGTVQSFIFSLDLRKKMTLTQQQYAIYCNNSYGPSFGGGHDIHLSSECNNNISSYTNFPYSYNYNSQYKNGQQSYTAFCGAQSGRNFKVAEYEVFKVSWK